MERPILMSTAMVQAYLAGRKTQTRRVLRRQPLDMLPMNRKNEWVGLMSKDPNKGSVIKCRYGVPGDVLWWREAFCSDGVYVGYKADNTEQDRHALWTPSIHMPRWASRITTPLVNVRVERLQDITEEDARAEGVELGRVLGMGRLGMQSYLEGYCILWYEINAKRGYPWDINPYVWVLEFPRYEGGRNR